MPKENQQDAAAAGEGPAETDAAPDSPHVLGEEELVDLADIVSAEALAPEEDPIQLLSGEIAALKDQLLRSMAETENVRARARREREESVKYAAVPLISDLLGVCDNLQRAIAAVPPDAAEKDEQLKNLLTGVQMTERELLAAFERNKIEVLEPLGEKLDPHAHEAMFEVPDPSKPSGTIVQVIQAGYRIHERLIRPARVGIARGGPAAAAQATDPQADASEPGGAADDIPGGAGSQVDTEA